METTRLRAWLDRWLEPRWRALLTWVVLAGVTALATSPYLPSSSWFTALRSVYLGSVGFVQERLIALSPVPVPALARYLWGTAVGSVVLHWFPPIMLRLGIWRTIAWIAIAMTVDLMMGYVVPRPSYPSFGEIVLREAVVLGFPAIAVIGCRSRPWAGFVAGGLAAGWWLLLPLSGWELLQSWWEELPWLAETVMSPFLFAIVMLYCTHPLPREPRSD